MSLQNTVSIGDGDLQRSVANKNAVRDRNLQTVGVEPLPVEPLQQNNRTEVGIRHAEMLSAVSGHDKEPPITGVNVGVSDLKPSDKGAWT